MFRRFCLGLLALSFLIIAAPVPVSAQSPDNQTAALREVHVDGQKLLSEDQAVALTRLVVGSQVGRADLQAAADKLVQSGLFAKVNYNFQTRAGVIVNYHVEEAPRIPAYFDNIPWFADSELADAIRKKLPFFDGTLPDGGTVVDIAADAIKELIASHGLQVSLEHLVIANPIGEGNVQQFHVQGAELRIASIEFSDPSLSSSKIVQQHLPEILSKPYSKMTIDLFLTEAIRPVYIQQGYLHAQLGPPEIRLTGNPSQKLPQQIPVYVPVTPGPVYHWKEAHWAGNVVLSEFTLTGLISLKPGDVANGLQIEAGWDRIREELARHGYLDAKLDPAASYDESAHAISYAVTVQEGIQYRFGKMILTGLSVAGERKLHAVWPFAPGDIFDKIKYEEILTKLQFHQAQIFGELPLHYESVGHWLQTDPATATVDVLLDFK